MFSVPDDLPEDTKGRLPAIMEGLKQKKNNEQIAIDLGVSKYVIAHDRLLWRRSEGYDTWVYEEFQRLHAIVADGSPELAYKVMGRLMARLITQRIKAEIKAQGKITVDVETAESIEAILGEYKDVIAEIAEKVVERIIPEDNSGEQVDSSQES